MNRAAKRLAEGAAFDGRTVHIESQPGALYDFEPLAASSKSSNSDCGLTSFLCAVYPHILMRAAWMLTGCHHDRKAGGYSSQQNSPGEFLYLAGRVLRRLTAVGR